jgi:hypothetical protein
MRPSKLRLPDRTAAATSSWCSMASAMGASRSHQAGRLEVARHGLGARSERGLDRRSDGQAPGDGVPGQQAGSHHDRRVGGVGAGGDGGDGHRARPDARPLPVDLDRIPGVGRGVPVVGHDRGGRGRLLALARGAGEGRRVAGGEGRGGGVLHRPTVRPDVLGGVPGQGLQAGREVGPEVLLEERQGHSVLWPSRPGDRGHHGGEVERQEVVEVGTGARLPPQALGLRVALHEIDPLGGPARQAEVGERLLIDGEERRRRPELWAHVGDRGPVCQGQAGQAVAGELDEGTHDAEGAEHLRYDQDEVRRRGALGQLTCQADAHDPGHGLVEGLAQEDRLRLDAPDAVAEDAQAVDHRGVGVGSHEGVGEGHPAAGIGPVGHDRGQELQVDLVDDARPWRHHPEIAEGRLGPAQELVALPVPLVLAADVEGEGRRRPEGVHLDRVVDDEVCWDEGIYARGIASESCHGVPHGGQVHDRRHPREVLEDDAGGHERDLGLGADARPPRCKALHVGRLHHPAARVPQGVLEQDLQGHRGPPKVDPVADRLQAVAVGEARTERLAGAKGVERHGVPRCAGYTRRVQAYRARPAGLGRAR